MDRAVTCWLWNNTLIIFNNTVTLYFLDDNGAFIGVDRNNAEADWVEYNCLEIV